MKIENITNKGVKPSVVSVVVNYNKLPKTFNLLPGEFIYVPGEFNYLITQAMRIQKQRGLIDFTNENEPVDELVPTFSFNEEELENFENNNSEINETTSVDIFDLALEDVQKEEEQKEEEQKDEEQKETPKRGKGRPKGSYKVSKRIREVSEKKSQENDK